MSFANSKPQEQQQQHNHHHRQRHRHHHHQQQRHYPCSIVDWLCMSARKRQPLRPHAATRVSLSRELVCRYPRGVSATSIK
eukprot:758475-Hanusia_phi.AAC.1